MLEALAAGQRDTKALAQLARGRMRGKIRRLEEALDCSFFTAEHAAVLAMMLAAIDYYTTQIEALTARIETLIEPYLRQVEQLDEIDGIGAICAQETRWEAVGNAVMSVPVSAMMSWAQMMPMPCTASSWATWCR